jgi:hypothetical protein
MMTREFEGVVALVQSTGAKADMSRRLEIHGARVVSRMCKSVTHIIYDCRLTQDTDGLVQHAVALSDLYFRMNKVGFHLPPAVVSPLWVDESITNGERMDEGAYAVDRPSDTRQTAMSVKNTEPLKKRIKVSKATSSPASMENIMQGNARHSKRHTLRRVSTHRRCLGQSSYIPNDSTSDPYAQLLPGCSTQTVADILTKDLPEAKRTKENARRKGNRSSGPIPQSTTSTAAQRFSLRQLSTHLERPLLVTRTAHPLQPTPFRKRSQSWKKNIPIPEVERVPSPWAHAEPFPSHQQRLNTKLPTPWTKERVWDHEKSSSRLSSSLLLSSSCGKENEHRRESTQDPKIIVAATRLPRAMEELLQHAVRQLPGKYIYYEGISLENKARPRKITHLVVGDDRRTLKLMLAVAHGAVLLSPEWVTASLEAGLWLPPIQYQANTRFLKASQMASQLAAVGKQLLSHHAIYVHAVPAASGRKALKIHVSAVRAVATALGASLSRPDCCTLCITVTATGQSLSKADSMSLTKLIGRQVPIVSENWLYQAVESMQQPPLDSET